jgi:hypothetical protein
MVDPVEFAKSMAAIVKDATSPLLKRIETLEAQIAERPPAGPQGERGLTGEAGAIGERGAAGERGEKGEAGEQGPQGPSGRDADPIDMAEVVAQLLSGDEVRTLISLEVAAAVAALPIQHGKDGAPGKDGERGPQGEKGDPGADGIGQAGAMIDRGGCLVLTTTKGDTINLGVVVGADGKDGTPGKDGADFTDCTIDYDGERSIIIRS